MSKEKEYIVLSPDKISIHQTDTYKSPEEAEAACKKWAKRYEKQGHYSSMGKRIPYADIVDNCHLVELKEE